MQPAVMQIMVPFGFGHHVLYSPWAEGAALLLLVLWSSWKEGEGWVGGDVNRWKDILRGGIPKAKV